MTNQTPPKLEELIDELHMTFDLIDFEFINVEELEAFIKKVYEAGLNEGWKVGFVEGEKSVYEQAR